MGKTQVVLAQSAPPVTGGAEGGLSGVCERWHWVLRMARTFGAAPAENYDAWICSSIRSPNPREELTSNTELLRNPYYSLFSGS